MANIRTFFRSSETAARQLEAGVAVLINDNGYQTTCVDLTTQYDEEGEFVYVVHVMFKKPDNIRRYQTAAHIVADWLSEFAVVDIKHISYDTKEQSVETLMALRPLPF